MTCETAASPAERRDKWIRISSDEKMDNDVVKQSSRKREASETVRAHDSSTGEAIRSDEEQRVNEMWSVRDGCRRRGYRRHISVTCKVEEEQGSAGIGWRT